MLVISRHITRALLLVSLQCIYATADPVYPGHASTCFKLKPYSDRDWYFECATVNTTATENGNVIFLHGNDGARSKAMWSMMMQTFAAKGFKTLAFDQRGFSPEASPYIQSQYNYNYLAEDLFAIADAFFGAGSKFHLVAHDQGARLGWHAIAIGTGRKRYLSYTPLSEAHSDAFSDSLYGPNADPKQQKAFMYLWDFTLPGNSTTAYKNNIWRILCTRAKHYATPRLCQPSLWWYIGAVESEFSNATFFNLGFNWSANWYTEDYVKEHTVYPLSGRPQTTKVGNVTEFQFFMYVVPVIMPISVPTDLEMALQNMSKTFTTTAH